MARKTFPKKIKNGHEYYFYRHYNPPHKPVDLYAKEVKELEKKIRDVKKKQAGEKSSTSETFGVSFKSWLYGTNLVNKKPSTAELYDGVFRNYIEKSPAAAIKMEDLKIDHIQTWYNNLFKAGKSTNIIKKINKLVAPFIRFSASTGDLTRDFSTLLKIPEDKTTTVKTEIRPMSRVEQEIFESHLQGEYHEALFRTALYTGIRQGELLALRWSDVYLLKRRIHIDKTYKVVKSLDTGERIGVVGPPKSKEGIRVVPVNPMLAEFLKKYRHKQIVQIHEHGGRFNRNMLVFHNGAYGYLDPNNVRKNLARYFKKCEVEKRRFHDLRHTYATRMFEMGASGKVVQKILGHSDVNVTLNTYTHVSKNVTSDQADLLDSIYGGSKKKDSDDKNDNN